ncbi:MAG: isoprenylcysteine carboxylmethyltransferase family protein [Candidatus Odinarchaeota archaeon]
MNDRVKILLLMVIYTPIVFVIFAAVILVPANDFSWLEGWLFIMVFFGYAFLFMLYSLIKDPEILLKRGKYTTDDPGTTSLPDKTFMVLAVVVFGFIFIFPGIDHASSISPLPWYIELLGFIGLITGLVFITYVNKVNRYASKGLVIHKDHELITSGPYRYVRHPMYVAIIIFDISIPVTLGSFIAFVVSLIWPIILIYRIGIEESMLVNHLPGYKDYMEQVKYRLIPRIY